MGVPALFILAYIYPLIPVLPKLPLCGARHFLGFDCPGCGLTRSFAALTHGNLCASIYAHPMGVIIALWMIYMFLRAFFTLVAGRRPKELLKQGQRDLLMYVFLAGLLLQWIFKLLLIDFH